MKKLKIIIKSIFTILIHLMLVRIFISLNLNVQCIKLPSLDNIHSLVHFSWIYWFCRVVRVHLTNISAIIVFAKLTFIFTKKQRVLENDDKESYFKNVIDLLDYSNPCLYGDKTVCMLN